MYSISHQNTDDDHIDSLLKKFGMAGEGTRNNITEGTAGPDLSAAAGKDRNGRLQYYLYYLFAKFCTIYALNAKKIIFKLQVYLRHLFPGERDIWTGGCS